MTSAIYTITNSLDGKQYVGSAVNFSRRRLGHVKNLRKGTHDNQRLQHAWNKYGEPAFEFAVLHECVPAELITHEQLAIDTLNPAYNILRIAGSSLGYRHTPEVRAELSRRATGRIRGPHSAETRQKMSISARGKIRSAEHSANIAAANTGKKLSPETRARMRAAHAGFRHTDESRRRMSESTLGKKRSEAGRRAIQLSAHRQKEARLSWAFNFQQEA